MPEPTQINDLPRVATEVPAIPGVSWYWILLERSRTPRARLSFTCLLRRVQP